MNLKKWNSILVSGSGLFFVIFGIIKNESIGWIWGGLLLISGIYDWRKR